MVNPVERRKEKRKELSNKSYTRQSIPKVHCKQAKGVSVQKKGVKWSAMKTKEKKASRGYKGQKKVYKSLEPYPQTSLIKTKGRVVRKKEKGHKGHENVFQQRNCVIRALVPSRENLQ